MFDDRQQLDCLASCSLLLAVLFKIKQVCDSTCVNEMGASVSETVYVLIFTGLFSLKNYF